MRTPDRESTMGQDPTPEVTRHTRYTEEHLRYAVLLRAYVQAGGRACVPIDLRAAVDGIALSLDEVNRIVHALSERALMEYSVVAGQAALTHIGVEAIQMALGTQQIA